MFGKGGRKRRVSLEDALGSLIPTGRVTERRLATAVRTAMDGARYLAGHPVPSVPTRYVCAMNAADRAALDPFTEDRLAAMLARHADTSGYLILGDTEVELRAEDLPPGAVRTWVGFRDDDLLVLSSPGAAAAVFAGR